MSLNHHVHHKILMSSQSVRKGEGDTILLWLSFILMDNRKGAAFCRDYEIPYSSAILFPRILALSGHFFPDECAEKTEQLIRNGRYSRKIIAYARNCPDRELLFLSEHPDAASLRKELSQFVILCKTCKLSSF